MTIRILALGLNFLVFSFAVLAESSPTQTITIPFYVRNGSVYSNLYSPEGRKLVCQWDTGSNVSLISGKYLESEIEGYLFDETSQTKYQVGPMPFRSGNQQMNLTFVVADLENINRDDRRDAILGTDMMENWTVRFDFPHQIVQLSGEPPPVTNFEFKTTSWLPFVAIELQGKPQTALIDLGFNGEFLVREALGVVPDEVKIYTGNSILTAHSQWDTTKIGRISSVAIFGESLSNTPVLILPEEASYYNVLVGYEFFRRGVLTLDFRNGKGLWERKEMPRKALNRLLPLNYNLVAADGAVHVSNVEAGKDGLGLVPGDTIVAVNGTPVEGSVDTLSNLLGESDHPTLLILRDSDYVSVTIDIGPRS